MANKNECKHKNGWVINPNQIIGFMEKGRELIEEIECECNNIGCFATRTFNFEITNVKVVKP